MATDLLQIASAAVVGAVGGTAAVTGLSRWLGEVWLGRILTKEKAKHDRQLEQLRADYAAKLEGYKDALERSKSLLQAQIDHSVFVTRAHFETEFDAYRKTFEDLAEVRLLMSAMHPLIRVAPLDESKDERLKELDAKLRDLGNAHNKAARTTENLAPFYPQEILERLNRCLKLVRIEILYVQTGGAETFSVDWSRQGEQRVEEFSRAY